MVAREKRRKSIRLGGERRTDMPAYLEVSGDVIKHSGDVLADLEHLAATGRAGTARLVHDVAGRQMRRQFAACPSAHQHGNTKARCARHRVEKASGNLLVTRSRDRPGIEFGEDRAVAIG